MASDPFDHVFTLEDRFYRQGYQQGLEDGEAAGRIEGRQFGMSTGFDKFLESGRLASRSIIWANRLPASQPGAAPGAATGAAPAPAGSQEQEKEKEQEQEQPPKAACTLPPLPNNARLGKNIKMVYALVEPETLSTANADDDVQDFDDRFKRAQGKAKVVEKMIG
ncbi:DUF1715 domain-containing protein [Cordyceps javanica]|uniref:DUF1715 domain-containing protein n=1 Tax=Cordyceps javanica TaxID=43265 RepID=A0A545VMD6_9HYPO|nr:DUF1715 domain-containing protein [Cordyceps javanica]TQW02898.1 DUF1715 domain-containing protein [Cordyceps javanica]